jgi:hypothetical protein
MTPEQRDIENAKAREARRILAEIEGRRVGGVEPKHRPQGESPTPRSPCPVSPTRITHFAHH